MEKHGEHGALVIRALALALALAGPAAAEQCGLALSLALDVSSSVDAREYRLQTQGLAAALVAPEVREAFLAEPGQRVALQIFQWSGWQQQLVRQDWVTIRSETDLDAVAARLGAQREQTTKALRKRVPSAARRSRFGVSSQGKRAASPCSFWTTPRASKRWSSVMTTRTLGRSAACDARGRTAAENARAASDGRIASLFSKGNGMRAAIGAVAALRRHTHRVAATRAT